MGPGFWQIIYYAKIDGKLKQKRKAFAGSREDAVALEHTLRLEANKEHRIATMPRINQVVPAFMAWYELDHLHSGVVVMRRYMGYFLNRFGTRQLATITRSDFEEYKQDRRQQGVKPNTINKEISALNQLIAWGSERGYCLAFKGRRFPAKMSKSPLPDVPTREECLKFIDALTWPAQGMFACLYYAGLRRGEAAGLTKEMVFLDRGMMIVRGKGNKQRAVPIADGLVPYLEKRIGEVESGLLWTNKHGKPMTDLREHIKWAKKRAGITRRIYAHLMRHSFGTFGTMDGIGLRAMQKIMGHSNVQTTELYTTLADSFLVEEIKKFGG